MIPALSLIIAMYVITRYIEMICNEQSKTITKILASIFILVTAVCIIDIYTAGSSVPNLGQ